MLFVDDWSFLNDSKCAFIDTEQLFCCEKQTKLPVRSAVVDLPEPGICGTEGTSNKIYGGLEAKIDDYPWMALLKYYKRMIYLKF